MTMKATKNKRSIQLSRIVAVNWYGFNQVIDVDGNLLITGEFGTGKSVILDLIQRVLLGSYSRFNRAAAGEASKRILKGYCLCDTNTGTDAAEDFARDQTVTFIALEFTWPGSGKRQTWGQRIEYQSASSRPSILYFCWPDRLDFASTCKEDGEFLEEAKFRAWLRREGGDAWDREESYLDNLGVPGNLNFEWPLLRQVLPEALAFQVIRRFDGFIRERLLPASPLQVDEVKKSLAAHQDYAAKLARYERQLNYLRLIRDHHSRQVAAEREAALLTIVERDMQLRQNLEQQEKAKSLLVSLKSQAESEAAELEKVRRRLDAARAALTHAQSSADADSGVAKLDGLIQEKEALNKKIVGLKLFKMDALTQLRERAANWRRWLGIGRKLPGDTWKENLDPREDLLAALETGGVDAGLNSLGPLAEHFHRIKRAGEREQERFSGQVNDLTRTINKLKEDIRRIGRGQTHGEFPLLEALRARLPRTPAAFGPEQLCRLVELEPEAEPWRRAIELFLRNNRFAIVLDSKRYRLARDFVRDCEIETRREPLVDPDEAIAVGTRQLPGSLAEKVTSSNPVAAALIAHWMGNVLCVESPDNFAGKARAITHDAILWQRPVLTKLGRASRGEADPYADYEPVLGVRALAAIREKKQAQLVLREAERIRAKEGSDAFTHWLERADQLSLSKPTLTSRIEALADLEQAEQRLAEVKAELPVWSTADREQRVAELNRLRGDFDALNREEATRSKSDILAKVQAQEKALEAFESSIAEARRSRAAAFTQAGGGILEQHVEETAARFLAQSREWKERFEQVANARSDAEKQAVAERGERQKQRALLRAEFTDFVSFDEEATDNAAYEEAYRQLDEQRVPEYRKKANESRKAWEERLRDQVLGELKTLTDRAVSDVRSLNATLAEPIGHYRYRLAWQQRRDGDFDLLWPLLKTGLEPTDPLMAAIHDPEVERAKNLLMEALNKPEDPLLQQRLDYRGYFKFDMECKDTALPDDSSWISLTRHSGKMSGGENQSPFFLAMLAAFLRVYRRAEPGRLGQRESLGLVPMDEAFSKLSGEGVENCMETAQALGLQLVLAMPDKDAPTALRGANTLLVVTIDKRHEGGRSLIENWAHSASSREALAELEGG